jgi:hypothetical protein
MIFKARLQLLLQFVSNPLWIFCLLSLILSVCHFHFKDHPNYDFFGLKRNYEKVCKDIHESCWQPSKTKLWCSANPSSLSWETMIHTSKNLALAISIQSQDRAFSQINHFLNCPQGLSVPRLNLFFDLLEIAAKNQWSSFRDVLLENLDREIDSSEKLTSGVAFILLARSLQSHRLMGQTDVKILNSVVRLTKLLMNPSAMSSIPSSEVDFVLMEVGQSLTLTGQIHEVRYELEEALSKVLLTNQNVSYHLLKLLCLNQRPIKLLQKCQSILKPVRENQLVFGSDLRFAQKIIQITALFRNGGYQVAMTEAKKLESDPEFSEFANEFLLYYLITENLVLNEQFEVAAEKVQVAKLLGLRNCRFSQLEAILSLYSQKWADAKFHVEKMKAELEEHYTGWVKGSAFVEFANIHLLARDGKLEEAENSAVRLQKMAEHLKDVQYFAELSQIVLHKHRGLDVKNSLAAIADRYGADFLPLRLTQHLLNSL